MSYQSYTIQLILPDQTFDLVDLSSKFDLDHFTIFDTESSALKIPVLVRNKDGVKFSGVANERLSNFMSRHRCLANHSSIHRKINSLNDSEMSYHGILRVTKKQTE